MKITKLGKRDLIILSSFVLGFCIIVAIMCFFFFPPHASSDELINESLSSTESVALEPIAAPVSTATPTPKVTTIARTIFSPTLYSQGGKTVVQSASKEVKTDDEKAKESVKEEEKTSATTQKLIPFALANSYTGDDVELMGNTNGYLFYTSYRKVVEDKDKIKDSKFIKKVPTGKKVGKYYIYYKTSSDAAVKGPIVSEVTRAELSWDNQHEVKDKTYDGTNVAETEISADNLIGIIAGEEVDVECTAEFETSDAGAKIPVSFAYTITGADIGNYTITNEPEQKYASISPKEAKVSPKTKTVEYTDSIPAWNSINDYAFDGFVDSNDLAKVEASGVSYTSKLAVQGNAPVGSYDIEYRGGFFSNNYTFQDNKSNQGELVIKEKVIGGETIKQAIEDNLIADVLEYNGEYRPVLSAFPEVEGVDIYFADEKAIPAVRVAGEYPPIPWSAVAKSGYTISGKSSGTISVTVHRKVEIIVDDVTRELGEEIKCTAKYPADVEFNIVFSFTNIENGNVVDPADLEVGGYIINAEVEPKAGYDFVVIPGRLVVTGTTPAPSTAESSPPPTASPTVTPTITPTPTPEEYINFILFERLERLAARDECYIDISIAKNDEEPSVVRFKCAGVGVLYGGKKGEYFEDFLAALLVEKGIIEDVEKVVVERDELGEKKFIRIFPTEQIEIFVD